MYIIFIYNQIQYFFIFILTIIVYVSGNVCNTLFYYLYINCTVLLVNMKNTDWVFTNV